MDEEDVLSRWSEYIGELFKDNRGERPAIKKNTDGPPILKAEVEAAIRKMKRGKATGPDGIEIILALEEMGIGMTTKLLNAIYDDSIGKSNSVDKGRPFWNYLLRKFKLYYFPNQYLSLDEGIIPLKIRLTIKQHMHIKDKVAKFWVKCFILCVCRLHF